MTKQPVKSAQQFKAPQLNNKDHKTKQSMGHKRWIPKALLEAKTQNNATWVPKQIIKNKQVQLTSTSDTKKSKEQSNIVISK